MISLFKPLLCFLLRKLYIVTNFNAINIKSIMRKFFLTSLTAFGHLTIFPNRYSSQKASRILIITLTIGLIIFIHHNRGYITRLLISWFLIATKRHTHPVFFTGRIYFTDDNDIFIRAYWKRTMKFFNESLNT